MMKLISDSAWDVAVGTWIGTGRAGTDLASLCAFVGQVIGFVLLLPAFGEAGFLWLMGSLHAYQIGFYIVQIMCAALFALGLYAAGNGEKWPGAGLITAAVLGLGEACLINACVTVYAQMAMQR